MKRVKFLVGIFLLIAVAVSYAQEPVFRIQDMDNQWKSYSDLKGEKVTVIDFWATWCQPCVRSLPLMNEMAEAYRSKGVNFIGISIDGPRNQSKVKPFITSRGITYPILKDVNSEVMAELNVTAVPTLIIYDAQGEMVMFHEGFKPGDEDLIREEIDNILSR